jgi:hypothetical protein
MNSMSVNVGLPMVARAPSRQDVLYEPVPVEPMPHNPYYFDDSQIVLKASQITWHPPSLLITHLSKGRRKDI